MLMGKGGSDPLVVLLRRQTGDRRRTVSFLSALAVGHPLNS